MGELLRNVKLLQSRADQPALQELTLEDFPLGRPGSARNAFYGVPDETTEGVYAAALTPLLRDLTAGAGLGVMRLGSSARHRQLLEGLSPHDIALVAAGLVPSLGVEPLRSHQVLHVQQGDRRSGALPPVPAGRVLRSCRRGSDGAAREQVLFEFNGQTSGGRQRENLGRVVETHVTEKSEAAGSASKAVQRA